MRINFVPQDQSTMSCGQACVAMLLNQSLAEATKLVGGGPTNAPDLVRALRRRFVPARLKRGEASLDDIPSLALVKLKDRSRPLWHWIIRNGELWLDPWKRQPVQRWRIGTWRITGYVPLVRR